MVVPRFTVRVFGEKEMFTMTMVFGGITPGELLFPYVLDVSLLHPHKIRMTISIIIPILNKVVFIILFLEMMGSSIHGT